MLRLIQSCWEYVERNDFSNIGPKRRGIYVLYEHKRNRVKGRLKDFYDVLYIGMTNSSIRARLRSHNKKKRKWTHFSVYVVWPNITNEEIEELEGLFRHLYSKDSRANVLNSQKRYRALRSVKTTNKEQWKIRTDFSRLGVKYSGY